MQRSLMTYSQLKFNMVDLGYDYLLDDFISTTKQEVVVCLTDFIRLIADELEAEETKSSEVLRLATKSKYPFILYKGLAGRAKDVVRALDFTRKALEDITDGKGDLNSVHNALHHKHPSIIDSFHGKLGYDISMFYECFLYNMVYMNIRTLRVPSEYKKKYGQIPVTSKIYPVKLIPKFGPEIAILLNPMKVDLTAYTIARDKMAMDGFPLFCTLTGDCNKIRSLSTKKSKFNYVQTLLSLGIEPQEITEAENTFIQHSASYPGTEEAIIEVTESVKSHLHFTRALRFLVADFESFNESSLRYLVEFE